MDTASKSFQYVALQPCGDLSTNGKGEVVGSLYSTGWDGSKEYFPDLEIIHINQIPNHWEKINPLHLKQLYKQLVCL